MHGWMDEQIAHKRTAQETWCGGRRWMGGWMDVEMGEGGKKKDARHAFGGFSGNTSVRR